MAWSTEFLGVTLDKNTIMSATANMSTAYNLTIISYALVIANGIWDDSSISSNIKTAALVGAIFGQLTFGYVGDCLGRSKAMFLTMAFTMGGALLGAVSQKAGHSDPYAWLCASRVILGIGVGGVYPLAATVAAESSHSTKSRGRQVSAVFSTQGLGFVLCPLMVLMCIAIFPSVSDECTNDPTQLGQGCNDSAWRLALALGMLPGLLMLPFRTTETKKEGFKSNNNFFRDISNREHWWALCGTAGGWFLFDITFYGNSLFSPTVLQYVFDHGSKQKGSIHDQMVHNFLVYLIALPGYWVATYLMDSWGRKNIQKFGFGMMFVTYGILALLLGYNDKDHVENHGGVLLFIYGLTFFFSNFGPNSTTFILPSESFPAECRASLNGFSAAMGKTGAAIGSAAFKPLSKSIGVPWVLGICAFISILGLVVTHIFVEDRRGLAMKGDLGGGLLDDSVADDEE
jgi:PHS family inorganic phosphate transporter-like MFS transporter